MNKWNLLKGFSLIELLLVISVLSVLIGIGMPRIKGMMDNARKVDVQKELRTMQGAIESYYMFSRPQVYPPTSTTVAANYLLQVNPKAIASTLYDPFNTTANTEYNYKLSTNGKYFVVYSVGFNGSAGSELAIDNSGHVTGLDQDDICITNGNGCASLAVCGNYQCATCIAGGCGAAVGEHCVANSECFSGYCDTNGSSCTTGEIGANCIYNNECQSGYYCANTMCSLTNGQVGDRCIIASTCESGYCDTAGNRCTDGSNGSGCGVGADCQSGNCDGSNTCVP